MAISIRYDRDNRPLYREAQEIPNRFQQVVRRGFLKFMAALKKRANYEILHGKKTGRVYWVHGTWATRRTRKSVRRRKHISSAPGETHANLTGRLRRSLSWRVNGWDTAEFGYGVSTDASNRAPFYGRFLEEGTRRMAPRPSLMNAIEREDPTPHFEAAFDREFAR